jgi:molybdopterin synthase catalytic subunit
MNTQYLLTPDALNEPAVTAAVSSPDAGGVVTFVGRVRDHARGRRVVALEYEAYPEMAQEVFENIAAEAKDRFAVREIAVHHRCGRLSVGDLAVVIAVSAAHRDAAFDACRYVIDQLKMRAPIWKKEFSPDGSMWVDERP